MDVWQFIFLSYLAFCLRKRFIFMAGNTEYVPPIEPEEKFLSGTIAGLFSLYDSLLMGIVTGPAENPVTIKGQINLYCGQSHG